MLSTRKVIKKVRRQTGKVHQNESDTCVFKSEWLVGMHFLDQSLEVSFSILNISMFCLLEDFFLGILLNKLWTYFLKIVDMDQFLA